MKKLSRYGQSDRKFIVTVFSVFIGLVLFTAFVPTTLDDFFMPGSQPLQSGNLETPQKCDNCHGGYDQAVEPAFNWRGSMMAQAMRDPLYMACLAIANQDAPESGDLCIRCHSPAGWLEGRSIPTNGSALNNNDMEGVQCDFCHKLVKPTPQGVNPYPGNNSYLIDTYPDDQAYLASIMPNVPPRDGNGMYVADASNAKRGPFTDAAAKHKMEYSPFHQDAALCGTCHDVSNPAFSRAPDGSYPPNPLGTQAPNFDTYEMFPVERTYSEWLMSDFNTPLGIPSTVFGGNKDNVSTCQDCHMRDVSGYGANKNNIPFRHDLPLHDMTGGNTVVPGMVAALFPNDVDQAALAAGVQRAKYMLENAATMDVLCTPTADAYEVDVKITNNTGHKLPSGYPEGRRIWINLQAYDETNLLVFESGAYNFETGELNILENDPKIYEIKPGLDSDMAAASGYPEGVSFHFAINNKIYFDNRIPPQGVTSAELESIQSPVIGYTYPEIVPGGNLQHWDNTVYTIPQNNLSRVLVTLYYQTMSKEYVEFLWTENTTNDAGQTLYDLWNAFDKCPPEVMEQVEVNVTSANPPEASFSASPASGEAPLEVQFTDNSTNGPISWVWDFGDGNTSIEQNPVHVYNDPGNYTASLTASNNFGSDTEILGITVTQPTVNYIFVQDITVSRISFNGNRHAGVCEVTITDTDGNLIEGASVSASYTGPTSGNSTALTNNNGVATLETKATKSANDPWCFSVLDVVLSGSIYNSVMNLETEDCESAKNMMANNGPCIEIKDIYPNPFAHSTSIHYKLTNDGYVSVQIYSIGGELMDEMKGTYYAKGEYQYDWDATKHPAGIYFVRIIADSGQQTYKLVKSR